uniref:Protein kinase domain-containing protein n=1 Tax=Macrostomum lignano TaxID=282301 RepID=A0A1I8FY18_9PLAT
MSDNFQSWTDISILGSGGFGKVCKVCTDTGSILAAKYIETSAMSADSQREVQNEVSTLRQLDHPNIVRFVTAKHQGNKLVVFTELIEGSDLSELGQLAEQRAVGFLHQICKGLLYLHTRNPPVLHRDLKGQNIMVTREGIVKIIDFGLSIKLNMEMKRGMQATDILMTCTNACGTLPFMAPNVKSDVWALGITVYQMISGAVPFYTKSTTEIIDTVTGSGAPSRLPVKCSAQLSDFYSSCTALDPGRRPPVRELLQHPIFSGY